MKIHKYLVGAAASAFLVVAPTAMAQQQGTAPGQPGTTSGPASGSSVEPSTQGAIGAGAPGLQPLDRAPRVDHRLIQVPPARSNPRTPWLFAGRSGKAGYPGRSVA